MENKNSTFLQFIKFGLVGVSNTVISYVTYVVCVYVGMHYILANIVSFIISVLNSYYWNNKFVFVADENETRIWWKTLGKTFIAYGFTGLILNNILLFLLLDVLNIAQFMAVPVGILQSYGYTMTNEKVAVYIAPLFNLIITIPLNYVINKVWAFKKEN